MLRVLCRLVALYTMSLLMHLFCSGHACLFLQLQFSALMYCGWLIYLCVTYATVTDLNCVPIENVVQPKPAGKCVSTRLRKLRAMFVLTFLLTGGLNQMMLRCLFLRGCCVTCDMYSSLWLKLLCPSAF